MGIAIWKNGGFEPLSLNPFWGPSGTARRLSWPGLPLLIYREPAQTLIELGAKDVPLMVEKHQVWRFFTPTFLHAGVIHLALNLGIDMWVVALFFIVMKKHSF